MHPKRQSSWLNAEVLEKIPVFGLTLCKGQARRYIYAEGQRGSCLHQNLNRHVRAIRCEKQKHKLRMNKTRRRWVISLSARSPGVH